VSLVNLLLARGAGAPSAQSPSERQDEASR
jgi:hypothetical protein